MQDRLKEIIEGCIREESQGSGVIEKGARIRSSGIIRNVRIGPYAEVYGALELQNGTLLSCSEDPAFIESGVIMKDFIAAEGARVDGGACLERTYVGQGVQAGDHLSAENALLFANSEALRSEVCSIFAGPYTVTHHASTLLIANMLSFFNGGSGTNQSNHMYKLGPVHQGIIERGCKTGSFAYLMMECHIGAFCVIIGKHMSNIDIPYFPFSYLLEEEGKSSLMPGISLLSIGIVRDDEKWPARDKRKGPVKRDCIIYDVFSPYTVEKMRRGRDILLDLYQKTPKDVDTVYTGGVQIKRLLLRKGAKYYRLAIDRYLLSVLLAFIEDSAKSADLWKDILNRVEGYTREEDLEDWVDMGGLILPRKRIYALLTEIREKHLTTVDELMRRIHLLYSRYREDERSYIFQAVEKEFGITISDLKPAELFPLIERWEDAAASLHALILENTKSEFGHVSRIGYGLDHETEREADFMAVRGSLQNNSVLKKFTAEKDRIYERARKVRQIVKRFA
jgi:hypothetical protein